MSSLRLSIIVPVYNVEPYIEQSLQTVVNFGLSKDAYEVIVVDDGSTDNSGSIAKQWSLNYPQIKVIEQTNRGLSAARNSALAVAQGEFILFLDSDDWLFSQTLLSLLDEIEARKVEMLLFEAERVVGSVHKAIRRPSSAQHVMSGVEAMIKYRLMPCVWSTLYRRDFLKSNDLTMPVGLLHEDELFTPQALLVAQRIAFSQLRVYAYRVRQNSITTQYSHKNVTDRLEVVGRLTSLMKKQATPVAQKALRKWIDWLVLDILRLAGRQLCPLDQVEFQIKTLSNMRAYPITITCYSFPYLLFSLAIKNRKTAILLYKCGLGKFF